MISYIEIKKMNPYTREMKKEKKPRSFEISNHFISSSDQ
jgi:hypothetical protein